MATYRDLLKQTKTQIREADTAEVDERRTQPGTVLLDVREPDEHEQGTIPGSVFIPRGQLESNVENRITDKDTPVLVYCAGGNRSAFAAKTLEELGYTNVVSMKGGFNRWKDEGREWHTPRVLTPDQRKQLAERMKQRREMSERHMRERRALDQPRR